MFRKIFGTKKKARNIPSETEEEVEVDLIEIFAKAHEEGMKIIEAAAAANPAAAAAVAPRSGNVFTNYDAFLKPKPAGHPQRPPPPPPPAAGRPAGAQPRPTAAKPPVPPTAGAPKSPPPAVAGRPAGAPPPPPAVAGRPAGAPPPPPGGRPAGAPPPPPGGKPAGAPPRPTAAKPHTQPTAGAPKSPPPQPPAREPPPSHPPPPPPAGARKVPAPTGSPPPPHGIADKPMRPPVAPKPKTNTKLANELSPSPAGNNNVELEPIVATNFEITGKFETATPRIRETRKSPNRTASRNTNPAAKQISAQVVGVSANSRNTAAAATNMSKNQRKEGAKPPSSNIPYRRYKTEEVIEERIAEINDEISSIPDMLNTATYMWGEDNYKKNPTKFGLGRIAQHLTKEGWDNYLANELPNELRVLTERLETLRAQKHAAEATDTTNPEVGQNSPSTTPQPTRNELKQKAMQMYEEIEIINENLKSEGGNEIKLEPNTKYILNGEEKTGAEWAEYIQNLVKDYKTIYKQINAMPKKTQKKTRTPTGSTAQSENTAGEAGAAVAEGENTPTSAKPVAERQQTHGPERNPRQQTPHKRNGKGKAKSQTEEGNDENEENEENEGEEETEQVSPLASNNSSRPSTLKTVSGNTASISKNKKIIDTYTIKNKKTGNEYTFKIGDTIKCNLYSTDIGIIEKFETKKSSYDNIDVVYVNFRNNHKKILYSQPLHHCIPYLETETNPGHSTSKSINSGKGKGKAKSPIQHTPEEETELEKSQNSDNGAAAANKSARPSTPHRTRNTPHPGKKQETPEYTSEDERLLAEWGQTEGEAETGEQEGEEASEAQGDKEITDEEIKKLESDIYTSTTDTTQLERAIKAANRLIEKHTKKIEGLKNLVLTAIKTNKTKRSPNPLNNVYIKFEGTRMRVNPTAKNKLDQITEKITKLNDKKDQYLAQIEAIKILKQPNTPNPLLSILKGKKGGKLISITHKNHKNLTKKNHEKKNIKTLNY